MIGRRYKRNIPGAMTPRIDLPPLLPHTNTSRFLEWTETYFDKVVNKRHIFANMPRKDIARFMAQRNASEEYWLLIKKANTMLR